MLRLRSAVCLPVLFGLITACSSGTSTANTVVCDQQFWNGMFSACLPAGWKVLSRDSLLTLGVPEETVAAFQFEAPHAGQLDTVTVTREPLTQDLSTEDYSLANILAVSALPDYKLIDKVTVFIDGKESALHIFSARSAPDKPIRRYYQLSAVTNRTGYTFTGAFPLSIQESEAAQVEFILKNVSFIDPATKSGDAE